MKKINAYELDGVVVTEGNELDKIRELEGELQYAGVAVGKLNRNAAGISLQG